MKSQGAAKNEANNAAQKASAETAVKAEETKAAAAEEAAPAKVEIDFSNVEVEPLFEDMVDFDTFSKSDFRAVKVKECEAVPKSKKLLKFLLDDGSGTDRVILSGKFFSDRSGTSSGRTSAKLLFIVKPRPPCS